VGANGKEQRGKIKVDNSRQKQDVKVSQRKTSVVPLFRSSSVAARRELPAPVQNGHETMVQPMCFADRPIDLVSLWCCCVFSGRFCINCDCAVFEETVSK